MASFSSPFTHWPQKFPRPIRVSPVVRGSGGWAVPFTPSTRTPPASPRRTGPHAPILSVEGSADPAGSHLQAIGEAGTISQTAGESPFPPRARRHWPGVPSRPAAFSPAAGAARMNRLTVVLIGAALIVLFVISFAASMRAPG